MPTPKPYCKSLTAWLIANLGKGCLAALTGTDSRALQAAVHIIDAHSYDRSRANVDAFGLVVGRMQKSTQYLAFHAIAHVMDWDDRAPIWASAGLSFDVLEGVPECKHLQRNTV